MTDYVRWLRSKVGHEPVIFVGAGVVIEDGKGKILLQKRGDNGQWGCPGGLIELGESAEKTAKREVREETGLSVKLTDVLGTYTSRNFITYPNGDKTYVVSVMFVGKQSGGKLKIDNRETVEIKWFSKKKLPKNIFSLHRDPLRDYANGKRRIVR